MVVKAEDLSNEDKQEICKDVILPDTGDYDPTDYALIEKYANSYYNFVETENAVDERMIQIEANYFLTKYGPEIYNELLQIRRDFLSVSDRDAINIEYSEEDYSKALENIHVLNQVLTVDKPIMSVIDKYIPEYDSNTIYREIEYRDEEYKRLYNINYYLNILYYVIFVVLIILVVTSNRFDFKKDMILYISLAILPFVYPWVFLLFRRIYIYFNPPTQYSGPKNAFIDTNIAQTAMFSNNVSNSYKNKVHTTTLN